MHYFSKFHASDPYLAFRINGRRIGLGIPMEYERMINQSAFDDVLLLPDVRDAAAQQFKLPKGTQPTNCQIVQHIANRYNVR